MNRRTFYNECDYDKRWLLIQINSLERGIRRIDVSRYPPISSLLESERPSTTSDSHLLTIQVGPVHILGASNVEEIVYCKRLDKVIVVRSDGCEFIDKKKFNLVDNIANNVD